MKKTSRKIIALTLIGFFSCAQVSFAEEISAPGPEDSQTTSVAAPPSDPVIAPAAASNVPADPEVVVSDNAAVSDVPVVQETVSTQPAATGDVLEDTIDPQGASSTESVVDIPLVEASTSTSTLISVPADDSSATPEMPLIESTTTLDVVADVPLEDPPKDTPEIVVPEVQPIAIAEEELQPKPEYEFALTGTEIPSKKVSKDKNGKVKEEVIGLPPATSVDNENGTVTVSGSCANVFFVILLFKNPTDYRDDPGSYIVNRAYPCVDGVFSYAISELPPTLPDGKYYLMVGEEGKSGPWTPITGLTEILINRNH